MAEVKWIKLNVDMFNDEKIALIESMPESDTILVLWIKLLNQAGKTNASGYIYLNEKIPFTDEMLSTIFKRPLNIVRLALSTFQNFGMIEIDESDFIKISNWEKHQNVDGLDRIREQNRLRKQREREKKRIESPNDNNNENGHVTVTGHHATDIDKDIDKDKDINKYIVEIISYLNQKSSKSYRSSSKKTKQLIQTRLNEGFRVNDFKKVIDNKCASWLNTDMDKFLRPETLFGTKFESYLNENPKVKISPKGHQKDNAIKYNELNLEDLT